MVTINVPRKRLSPIFLLGFFISPAINVTLFHASLLKIEPTIAAAIPPNKAVPAMGVIAKPAEGLQASFKDVIVDCQAFVQFACHTSGLNMMNPAMISPNSDNNFVEVK